MAARVVILSLALLLAGCGSGAVVIFGTNLGVVTSDASCHATGGQFNLRDQQGLVVLVILNGNSNIFLANGSAGNCGDLTAGTRASVRGAERDGQVTASTVNVLN